MQWTNLYNLPQPLVSAIKNDTYEKVGDISVTGLNQSPQMRQLKIRHDDEIVEDVSDHIWRFFGQLGHELLERADTKNHLSEERLTEMVEGLTLSGKMDLYDPATFTLIDYKFTSVFSFLLGEKPDWERQLNIYRWLLMKAGFVVEKLQITAILRDWSRSRSRIEPDYPPAATMTVDIPLWSVEKVEAEIKRLVIAHKEAATLPDHLLPDCSAEDRWERPTTYAVKKKDAKRAFRVLDNLKDAEAMATENKMEVEIRPGENIRCENFCPVKGFCHQYAQSHKVEIAA